MLEQSEKAPGWRHTIKDWRKDERGHLESGGSCERRMCSQMFFPPCSPTSMVKSLSLLF